MKRVFLIVLDSVGIGYAPDAEKFADVGANTMKRISESKYFKLKSLIKLGLSNIDGIDYLPKEPSPIASYARLSELSMGKDTTIGHWEICGIVSEKPLPTYPDGFPKEIIDEFKLRTGRGVLCNKPYSGTEVIDRYAKEHQRTGDLIVYTSADSVFQIAADEAVVPVEELYRYCKIAREILVGKHAVGRVIARPFIELEDGKHKRTANRHDFSLLPPKPTLLDAVSQAKKEVIAVGKINDIFASRGVTESILTHGNREGMDITFGLLERDFEGLAFTNLVDFDMLYGHRQDIDGYAKALSEFDMWIGEFCKKANDDDLIIITADHGCDPGDSSTDHTREYVPLIIYNKKIAPKNLGTQRGFTTVSELCAKALNVTFTPDAVSGIADAFDF